MLPNQCFKFIFFAPNLIWNVLQFLFDHPFKIVEALKNKNECFARQVGSADLKTYFEGLIWNVNFNLVDNLKRRSPNFELRQHKSKIISQAEFEVLLNLKFDTKTLSFIFSRMFEKVYGDKKKMNKIKKNH